jgi:large subunit ribosomal protein L30
MLKVTLVKSFIGYSKRLRKTLSAMGLGKVGSCTVLPDNAPVRGMIRKTEHIVKVELLADPVEVAE